MMIEDVAGDLSVNISILLLVVRKKTYDCHAPQQRQSKEQHVNLQRSDFL